MTKEELAVIHDYQLQEKIINEEFKIWKKTVPLLYDTIRTNSLESPSLFFNWLPGYKSDKAATLQYVIGTNSATDNSLELGSIDLPKSLLPESAELNPNSDFSNFKILSKWKQSSEINKSKVSPNGDQLITFNNDGTINYYPIVGGTLGEETKQFKYHKVGGDALEWLTNETFVSGAKDTEIALWDISNPSTPTHVFKSHGGAINGLSRHPKFPYIFGSVSDDRFTHFYDTRDLESNPTIRQENKLIQNSISFHPQVDTLYASAGKDNIVNLYDLRNHSTSVRRFFGHNESVIGLKWDPHDANILVSWALDKRVILWDLAHLKEEFSPDENSRRKTKSDPCLKFIHAGHTNRINDLDIHPQVNNLYATVGEDGLLEIWKPKTVLEEEEEEEEVNEND